MKTIKIFVSSSVAFSDLRNKIILYFNNKSKIYSPKIEFYLEVFEDIDNPITSEGTQEKYNAAIRKCDYLLLFYSNRVGKFTLEEFITAIGADVSTYIYKLPDDIIPSTPDPNSIKVLRDSLPNNTFANQAKNIDELLNLFYSSIERLEIVPRIKDDIPLMNKYLLSKKYMINRNNQISDFEREIKTNNKSCTIFIYKADKDDQPNYFNRRLDERLNRDKEILDYEKYYYIDLNEIFESSNDTLGFLYRFVGVLKEKFQLFDNSDFLTPKQFLSRFYQLLEAKGRTNVILPFRLKGRLELDENPEFINDVIDFFKIFAFKKNNGTDIRIHFVINVEGEDIANTEFYKKIALIAKVKRLYALPKIFYDDIERWTETLIANGREQEKLTKRIIEFLGPDNELPQKMAMVELPLEDAIKELLMKDTN
jgi:hypothetical protein